MISVIRFWGTGLAFAMATAVSLPVPAAVVYTSQDRSIFGQVAEADGGQATLDEATDSAFDLGPFFGAADARYDVTEVPDATGVVDAAGEQVSSFDDQSIQATGSAQVSATATTSDPLAWAAAGSFFEVAFTLTEPTTVQLTGELGSTRDASSLPGSGGFGDVGAQILLRTDTGITVFLASYLEGQDASPVTVAEQLFLVGGDYVLEVDAFAAELAEELFEVTASFDVSLEIPEPATGLIALAGLGIIALRRSPSARR
ncbi:MAG: hypothetical protein AAF333_19065 [Planctomycetota bacterium]